MILRLDTFLIHLCARLGASSAKTYARVIDLDVDIGADAVDYK